MGRRKLSHAERWQTVGMVRGGMSYRQTAEGFNVNHSVIVRLKQRVKLNRKCKWTPKDRMPLKTTLRENRLCSWFFLLENKRIGKLVFYIILIFLVPITTKVVSSNPAHGELYMIQHYVIKFVSNLWQVCGFLWVLRFPPSIILTAMIYNVAEMLLKMVLNTIALALWPQENNLI